MPYDTLTNTSVKGPGATTGHGIPMWLCPLVVGGGRRRLRAGNGPFGFYFEEGGFVGQIFV